MKHLLALIFAFSVVSAYAQEHPVASTDAFTITGSVKNVRTVTLADITKMPQADLGDISLKNKKGEDKGTLRSLKGVLLKDILADAEIVAARHKNYSELCVVLTASDGYSNVYSWNELFNTPVGEKVYIITEQNSTSISAMSERILVMSLADKNSGSRHLKGLQKIEVKKPD